MTIELHSVAAIRFLSESSFCLDASNNLGQYTYLPAREGSATLTLERPGLDPMTMVQSRADYRKEVFGPKKATLAFTINMAPLGVAAGSGTLAQTGPMGRILKAVMGGEHLGRGTFFTGTANALTPTVSSTGTFEPGAPIGYVNSSGTFEIREIKSIAGNQLTLNYAFSSAPLATGPASVCYAGATYFITEDPQETLQFLVEGAESQDRWLLLGGQCTSFAQAVDVAGAALPSFTMTFTFADWKDSAETSGSITGGLSDATYLLTSPIVGYEGEFRITNNGTGSYASGSVVHVSAVEITPKVGFVPVTSPNGRNTIYRWRGSRLSPPVEGSFTTFFEDLEWFDARDNRTDCGLFYQMGMAPGETVCESVPTIQILNPQRVAQGELAGQTVQFKARRNIDIATTGSLAKSPIKIIVI
jgi:hypothetical protein